MLCLSRLAPDRDASMAIDSVFLGRFILVFVLTHHAVRIFSVRRI